MRNPFLKATYWFQQKGKEFNNREWTSKHAVFLGHIVYAEKLMLFLKLIHDN